MPNAPEPVSKTDSSPSTLNFAASLVIAAILIAALHFGQDVLIPLAIAFLISFALSPLVTKMVRLHVPRPLAVLLVMVIVGGVLGGLGVLLGTQLKGLSTELPTYQTTIKGKIERIKEDFKASGFLEQAMGTVEGVQDSIEPEGQPVPAADAPQKVEVIPPPTSPFETAITWLTPALAPLATAGIVIVFVFLVLLDQGDLRDRLIRLVGGNLHRTTDAMEEAGARISRYLIMQVIVNVSYGVPMALGLWLIGVPGWLLWGALAALMRFIPYVGPMISAIFPLALAFAVDPSWNMVLWTLALILVLELVSNNIVEPMLYGSSTGLSAMSIIAAATFWTALWGPVGLILSTPLTVCLLVLGRNLPQLHFFETLLGSTPVLDIPTRIYQRLLADDPTEAREIVESVVEDDDISAFYNEHGIKVLQLVSDDYHNMSRAEHRLRLANGMDVLLDELREEYPPSPLSEPPRVALLGGKWEIDSIACEMLAHALALQGIPTVQRREAVLTKRHFEKLELEGIDVIVVSYFSNQPDGPARSYCRRLRQFWPGRQIVLALWNAPAELLDKDAISAMGADTVATSIAEVTGRLQRLLSPEEALQAQIAPPPPEDEARVQALVDTQVLDGHAREDLDALAKRAADVFDVRFAVISAINDDQEFIIGQSMELPGRLTRDGTDMITMPRAEAICDHVVSSAEILVVPDTQRDARFMDHPAIQMWSTRFYAGAPLTTPDGHVLGALCLLDTEPRELSEEETALLATLASDVIEVITGDEAPAHKPKPSSGSSSASLGQAVPH